MTPTELKKKTVEDFARLFEDYPVIAIVNMENLPAKQLQMMRSSLRNTLLIKMCKRRLLKLALEKSSKNNIKEIENYLEGMPAIIFSKESPFKLYKLLEKSKSTAPAKPGQKAPKDIIVPAGPTGFAPGPIIGELGQAGIKAGIDAGKVIIKEDSVVARKGDILKEEKTKVLVRLGIEPMEIGLNVVAVYEDGNIYTRDILSIDESKYLVDVQKAARAVFNLSLGIGYVTKDNIIYLISKAFNDSKNLALSQDLITDLTLNNLVGKAESQMKNLASKLNLPEKEEVTKMEEIKKEEGVKEQPKEETEIKEKVKKVEEVKKEKVEEKQETEGKKQKTERKKEKKLEEIQEDKIESKQQVTEEDMKQAEENLKRIQEQIQKKK